MNKLVPVFEAVSVIQRDAILSHLESLGIRAVGAQRDLSRKYADSSFDYSFEGYSATMGGFNIFVESGRAIEAKEAIETFLRTVEAEPPVLSSDLDRFYRASLFFMGPVALYYMVKALGKGELKSITARFWIAVGFAVLSTALWVVVAFFYFEDLLNSTRLHQVQLHK